MSTTHIILIAVLAVAGLALAVTAGQLERPGWFKARYVVAALLVLLPVSVVLAVLKDQQNQPTPISSATDSPTAEPTDRKSVV